MLDKRREKEKKLQKERQLRKEFETSSYLSVSSLESVKARMERFEALCKMENMPRDQREYSKPRQ